MSEIKHEGYTQYQMPGKRDLFLFDFCIEVGFGGYEERVVAEHVKEKHK